MGNALQVGLKGENIVKVCDSNTAAALGSGCLPVFSTPSMIAAMELAACRAVEDHIDPDRTTVGTELNVQHLAPTPVGMEVRATAELTAVEGKRLVFRVEAYDACGLIGEGTHARAIIHRERFMEKANGKKG